MTLTEFAIVALAGHRLWTLYLRGMFPRARTLLGRVHPNIGGEMPCEVCVSVWAGALMFGLWHVPYAWVGVVLFALSGAIDWLQGLINLLGACMSAAQRSGMLYSGPLPQQPEPTEHG